MKIAKKLILMLAILGSTFLFFRALKVSPTPISACNQPKLVCIPEEQVAMPIVDTSAIIKLALDEIHAEIKDSFLSELANKKLWGIDISKYQSNINWPLMVRKNKPDFVIAKVSEGTTILDPMYKSHKRNLEKHEILHGGYHFMSFTSSGRSQALKFIRYSGLKKGDITPVLDVEYTSRSMPSKRRTIREIKNFCDVIEQHYGVKPIIYTHPHLYARYLKGSFDEYPLWLCDYRNTPRHDWDIWQHTSSARIHGLNVRVDKNVMKNDKETLNKLVM